jgi:DNA repair photolyase
MVKMVQCKSALSKSSLPGLQYTFNPYVGCQHGCLYCYVPDVMRRPGAWGEEVSAKEGVLELLRSDLKRCRRGVVGVSTVTDPYQPAEKELEITRGALQILKSSGFPVSVQTKSSLVRRDLDIMRGGNLELGVTITSLDVEFQRTFEPGASPPEERALTLEEAASVGIKTWVFYGPIIPSFNDSSEDIGSIVALAKKTKSRIIFDKLNLKPFLTQRMQKIIINDLNKKMKDYDFKRLYEIIKKECEEKRVACSFAFGADGDKSPHNRLAK